MEHIKTLDKQVTVLSEDVFFYKQRNECLESTITSKNILLEEKDKEIEIIHQKLKEIETIKEKIDLFSSTQEQ